MEGLAKSEITLEHNAPDFLVHFRTHTHRHRWGGFKDEGWGGVGGMGWGGLRLATRQCDSEVLKVARLDKANIFTKSSNLLAMAFLVVAMASNLLALTRVPKRYRSRVPKRTIFCVPKRLPRPLQAATQSQDLNLLKSLKPHS